MKPRQRIASDLSESVNRRLEAYSLAAAAAETVNACDLHKGPCHHSRARWPFLAGALGALAFTQLAEAKIVYTPANVYIHNGGPSYFNFDLNHDGVADVGFSQHCWFDSFGNGCWLFAKPDTGNGVEGVIKSSGYGWAAALKKGEKIGPADQFDQSASVIMNSHRRTRFGSVNKGYWNYSQARYLGVAFQIKGKTHYGWMRLKNSSDDGATLTGYAYETVPGKAIKAGQTKGADDLNGEPNVATPDEPGPGASLTTPVLQTQQPASLGTLALGARGVPLWRRKAEVEAVK